MKTIRNLSFLVATIFLAAYALAGVEWSKDTSAVPAGEGNIRSYTADITADGAGNASGSVPMNGIVLRGYVRPKLATYTSGTTTITGWPTNLWDCTLQDRDGYDVVGGQLTNQLTTTAQAVTFTRSIALTTTTPGAVYEGSQPIVGDATISCSTMGTFRKASVRLYVKE